MRSQTRSATRPAANATRRGTPTRGGVDPGSRGDALEDLADGQRFPVGDHQCLATRLGRPVERSDEGIGGVVDVGGVDQCRAGTDDGEAALAGPVDDASDELGVAGPPHQVRPDGGDGEAVGGGGECEQLGLGLGGGVVAARGRGVGRLGGRARPAPHRRGRPTATTRARIG